jgi:hypothetical protein
LVEGKPMPSDEKTAEEKAVDLENAQDRVEKVSRVVQGLSEATDSPVLKSVLNEYSFFLQDTVAVL